ncbi:formimidoylglutamate deiminase [Acerihabitans sp. TG2]|uniref:formimidoylglutamate deiminase n=1 Tax=Acerihabitans sp. TG2 TaxID=3096008 RepID=UPI002B225B65|nr:formimidoylglutamate deiminase [Acerihabitans sp. TG2]MEA9391015.1 formimidoylglutamate deiminase [Acerihabitans sp. TG2]
MPVYFAPRALLPHGWQHNVLLHVNPQGQLIEVQPNASQLGATPLAGPVVPAMPNVHSHAFQRAMAGLSEIFGDPTDSFWTWRELMYRMVQRLSPEQVGIIARQLYIEMLKGGYSQVAEFHYLHHAPGGEHYDNPLEMALQISQAATQSGIGLTLLPVLYSYAGFGAQAAQPGQRRFIQDTQTYLHQQQTLASALVDVPLQRVGLCFHSLRAVSPAQLTDVLAAAPQDFPVHIHVAEQQKEVDDCLAWSGCRPVQWLLDHMPVNDRWCLIHATHLDAAEVSALARHQLVVGLCPTTEANLGDGIFPATEYLGQGGRWGIGSDSHVSLNVVEELRWLEYGQRLRDRRRNRLVTQQHPSVGDNLFSAALAGGAQACGVAIGRLEVGYRADWLVLDGDDPYIQSTPDDGLLNRWIFAGGPGQIRDVFVAGKQVINQGHHPLEQTSATDFARVLRELREEAI